MLLGQGHPLSGMGDISPHGTSQQATEKLADEPTWNFGGGAWKVVLRGPCCRPQSSNGLKPSTQIQSPLPKGVFLIGSFIHFKSLDKTNSKEMTAQLLGLSAETGTERTQYGSTLTPTSQGLSSLSEWPKTND